MPMVLKKISKIGLIILVLLMPILLLAAGFMFFTPTLHQDLSRYKISGPMTPGKIKHFIGQMSRDPEFSYYFAHLPSSLIERVQGEVNDLLNVEPQAEAIFKGIQNQQKKVRSIAILFLSLDYPKDFFTSPKNYPELNAPLGDFLVEEFKLTVISLYYKANLKNDFSLAWDDNIKRAAKKFDQTIQGLNQHRQEAKF